MAPDNSAPDNAANDLITVGFDGSEASLAALKWAVANSHVDPSKIQVVTAYARKDSESIDVARMRAEATVNLALNVNADVIPRTIAGEPTEVLLECSEHTRLIIVGRHGTSGIIHSALGSVGDACARLASCPVVIVPPARR